MTPLLSSRQLRCASATLRSGQVLPAILYDGHCRFCVAAVKKLTRFLPRGGYQALDFQDPDVLPRFPGITHAQAMRAMIFVDARGRVFSGMEAAARAVSLRGAGKLALLYYLPGVRQ